MDMYEKKTHTHTHLTIDKTNLLKIMKKMKSSLGLFRKINKLTHKNTHLYT